MNVFTVTFDQLNASFINNSINFLPKLLKESVSLYYSTLIIIKKKILEQQISLLEWFLKDHN